MEQVKYKAEVVVNKLECLQWLIKYIAKSRNTNKVLTKLAGAEGVLKVAKFVEAAKVLKRRNSWYIEHVGLLSSDTV